jgi:heptosyltransferase I
MSAPRICLIKTSSMGDVIHALPVVSDIKQALPGARIDWVVEEAFADLPRLHAGVDRTLPVAIRRWRKSLTAAQTRLQIRQFRAELRARGRYDTVLDLQGLYKSALIACAATGPRVGFSFRCTREPLAALVYARRYSVDMKAHAIERLRQLAAQAFRYPLVGLPRFHIAADGADQIVTAPRPYVVLLHATSRAEKLWPIACWQELIVQLTGCGYGCVLPWGSDAEREQAVTLASITPATAVVPPRLTLKQCAALLAGADAVVGVDTGLTHLAAALDRPTISIFGATQAWRFGPYWSKMAVNLGGQGKWPTSAEVLTPLLSLLGRS